MFIIYVLKVKISKLYIKKFIYYFITCLTMEGGQTSKSPNPLTYVYEYHIN